MNKMTMKMTTDKPRAQKNITIPHDRLTEFCQRWQNVELALFGSVLRDDFRPDSDIDVLVTFAPGEHWSLFDLVAMQDEISSIFGRQAHLIEPDTITNPFRRRTILEEPKIIYAA